MYHKNMRNLSRSLVYEVIRMEPSLVCSLQCVSTGLQTVLRSDSSYLQTLCEELFTNSSCREMTFEDCLEFIRFPYVMTTNDLDKVRRVDLTTMTYQEYTLPVLSESIGPGFTMISPFLMFICGISFKARGNEVYTFNFQT
jgi:hypothetical protein